MWYVIQTESGNEHILKNEIVAVLGEKYRNHVMVPLYEDVWRKGGTGHITIKKMFPGYLFIETDAPISADEMLKNIDGFKTILGVEDKKEGKTFVPINKEDEEFIKNLFEEGMMHVSYIKLNHRRQIGRIVGPLSNYRNKIVKLDIPHRRAIVDSEIFGKRRRIKFGLWTDEDKPLAWLEEKKKEQDNINFVEKENKPDIIIDNPYGIHEGDIVVDSSGIYVDQRFKVKRVDNKKNLIFTETEILGTVVEVELLMDQVLKES
ncbi:transcription termination/antitermination NusG family protein [Butyrivibrio sp. AE2015]|uniref:transcription termination/antitermination NusG family protein n=1 Tax=Butyrivibrio sp. AE2015 TaxID=1280663 RepID=UPI0003B3AC44|nr:transcription termination/antitermination NusG family protein [Butyrivibrio sp. AE2015]